MIEQGIVSKVYKNLAWITLNRGEQCAGCTACKSLGDNKVEITALNTLSAKPGDKVEVEVAPGQVIKHSAIVFLIPVFGLIFGYFLGHSYLTRIGFSTEAAGIVGSLGLMVLCFFGIVGYDRMIGNSQEGHAKIIRIV